MSLLRVVKRFQQQRQQRPVCRREVVIDAQEQQPPQRGPIAVATEMGLRVGEEVWARRPLLRLQIDIKIVMGRRHLVKGLLRRRLIGEERLFLIRFLDKIDDY